MSNAARGAAGALASKFMRGIAVGNRALSQALLMQQAEADLIARGVMPAQAHFIARAEVVRALKAAA